VTLGADGKVIGMQRIYGIRDNTTLSIEWRPPENRTYTLILEVDPENEVHERDEMNNILTMSVEVLLPDLIPHDLRADEGVYVNARNPINLTVEGMAENFSISLIENGTVVGKTTNVTCYGTENVTVYWKPTTLGNHTITAFVDSDGAIVETNETDNNITATFEVLRPDLVPVNIEPDIYYIDEFNDVNIGVNGTAEDFNVTLLVNYAGTDESGDLNFFITPIVNQTDYERLKIPGTDLDSNLTCNITGLKNWSWDDLNELDLEVGSGSETGTLDKNDSWNIDYVALSVNYTANGTDKTIVLNVSNVTTPGNWKNVSDVYVSDGVYVGTENITSLYLEMDDPENACGNITSVTVLLRGHTSNALTPPQYRYNFTMTKEGVNTYNHSINFGWVPRYEGIYNLTVFLDADNDINETAEANNNISREVLAVKRIKLELTSPVGGETWTGVQNITWNATYEDPVLIDLFYSPDRGYRWIPIATNETNDGVYQWDTEDAIDGKYMIEILAHAGKVWEMDQSGFFYIRNNNAGIEWGSFHANAGYYPGDSPNAPEIAWVSEDIGAEGSSSLIVARGKIFVYCTGWSGMYSDYTYLVALDQSNGEVLWGTEIAPRVYGSWATPAYKDGSVYVSSGNGVYRIDADTGEVIWEFKFPSGGGSVNGGPAVTKRAVYVGDWEAPGGGGTYYSFNTSNPGDIFWEFDVSGGGDGHSQAVPAVAYGNVYFGSFNYYSGQSHAYCVDAVSGEEIWKTPSGAVCGSVTVADHIVYFSTYTGGKFYALDAFNGSVIWTNTVGWTDSTPAYMPGSKSTRSYIYFTKGYSGPGTTYCLDAKTGEIVWQHGGVGYWTNSPVVTGDGKVYAGKYSGGFIPGYCGLYCLDAFTGDELWHSDYGGSSPVIVNGFVYTIDACGRGFAFGEDKLPDLSVLYATAPDPEYRVEKPGTIKAMIQNIGKSDVTEEFKVELREGADLLDVKTVSGLNMSNTTVVEFDWIPETLGNHNLIVEVDPDPGVIYESDSMNNVWGPLKVYVEDNKPDLVVEIEDVVFEGSMVTVKVNITNIGHETHDGFWVRFSVDGVRQEERWVHLSDHSLSLSFTWSASGAGMHTLKIEANPADNPAIQNEVTWMNNEDSREIEVFEPTSTPTPGLPHGYGGGGGGGSGIFDWGEFFGSGTGSEGNETGEFMIPINETESVIEEESSRVNGYPMGEETGGSAGGGGKISYIWILIVTVTLALVIYGYWRESRFRGGRRR